MRITFLVDGFNLYHSIAEKRHLHKYKWLNLPEYLRQFLRSEETLEEVYYFSALCSWNEAKRSRHRLLIKALTNSGVHVVLGKFKERHKECRHCGRVFMAPEEKETDVNIAIYLFYLAFKDKYDTAIVVSGDTDLTPAIKLTKKNFPNKKIGVFFPPGRGRYTKEMKQICDFHKLLKEEYFNGFRYPDEIVLPEEKVLSVPSNWK